MKPAKIFRYIENRDKTGRLIGLIEVKSTTDAGIIAELHREVEKNQTTILSEQAKRDTEMRTKVDEEMKVKREAEEKRLFMQKYSFQNLLIAAYLPIITGKFNLELLYDLCETNDKETLASIIKARLDLPQYAEVKKYFDCL